MCGSVSNVGGVMAGGASSIQAQLQGVVEALEQLSLTLGGAVAGATGGGKGIPTQAEAGHAHVGGASGGKKVSQGKAGVAQLASAGHGGSHAAGGHDKIILQSTVNDPARAQRVMTAAMDILGPLTYAGTGVGQDVNGTHRKIPASAKAAWKAKYPDLPVPNVVVFDNARKNVIGALFVGGNQAKDLGAGTQHQHKAGAPVMQHMWFIPNDMDLAFSDVNSKQQAIQAATAAMASGS